MVKLHNSSKAFDNSAIVTINRILWRITSSLKCKWHLKLVVEMVLDSTCSNALYSRFIYVATWMLTRRIGKSIHFHLFIFVNVVAAVVIFECLWKPFRNFKCNMLLANWQINYIHTYQIWFQIFNFSIGSKLAVS